MDEISGQQPRRALGPAARVRIGMGESAHTRDRQSASRNHRRDQAIPTTVTHQFSCLPEKFAGNVPAPETTL
ncbi:hypothetical protein ACH4XT_27690 [Streptomyces avidinii]|uniref:hypothetical protein n=1 Tax=Streptomyces avidinii TaxID=1895 RepID=UPI0037B292E5|nr:hypothetical protein OG592_29425 [Streptomyces avidinii]